MRLSAWTTAVAAAACLGGAACGAESGAYDLHFAWETEPDGDRYLWVRVEDRRDPEARLVLQASGPHLYTDGALAGAIELGDIPNGTDRVVIVEVREGPNPGLRVTHWGISDPFAVRAGEARVVPVQVRLQVPETERLAILTGVWLSFDGVVPEDGKASPDQLAAATVHTRSHGASAIVLANDPAFNSSLRSIALDDPALDCRQEEVDGDLLDLCDLTPWDLTADQERAPAGGVHGVFAKFVGPLGYESSVHSASMVLDDSGPAILAALVSDQTPAPDASTTVTLVLDEPLDEASPGELRLVDIDDVALPHRVGAIERFDDAATYRWRLDLTGLAHGTPFELGATLRDRRGLVSVLLRLTDAADDVLVLTVDDGSGG